MNKPREFWIFGVVSCEEPQVSTAFVSEKPDAGTHVIEYSAYLDIANKQEEDFLALHRAEKEVQALKQERDELKFQLEEVAAVLPKYAELEIDYFKKKYFELKAKAEKLVAALESYDYNAECDTECNCCMNNKAHSENLKQALAEYRGEK